MQRHSSTQIGNGMPNSRTLVNAPTAESSVTVEKEKKNQTKPAKSKSQTNSNYIDKIKLGKHELQIIIKQKYLGLNFKSATAFS